MILPDVNIYVYALQTDSPFHALTRDWLEEALNGEESVALWEVSLVSAYRLLTHPTMLDHPFDPQAVLDAFESIHHAPAAVTITPGPRFWEIFSQLVIEADVRGPLMSDAMLAALATEHRCRIATFDKDFAKFKGLQVFRPTP